MKRFLVFFISLLLLLSLVACQRNETSTNDSLSSHTAGVNESERSVNGNLETSLNENQTMKSESVSQNSVTENKAEANKPVVNNPTQSSSGTEQKDKTTSPSSDNKDTITNKGQASSGTSTVSETNSVDEQNTTQTDSTKEATTERKMITMNITVGSTTFTATLEDNDTAKAFVKQLPLTLDMSELNGNEKYDYLSSNLRADTPSRPGRIKEGDLMLYGNNCLVLFYETFNTSYSYVKLGYINDTTGLAKAIGSGSVRVTFSISD